MNEITYEPRKICSDEKSGVKQLCCTKPNIHPFISQVPSLNRHWEALGTGASLGPRFFFDFMILGGEAEMAKVIVGSPRLGVDAPSSGKYWIVTERS